MTLSETERRVLKAINLESLLATLTDLIALPTLGGQETPGQEYVARFLQHIGAETDVWDIDLVALRQHPSYGEEVPREHALGVVGALGQARGGRSLILNGHMDVVPAGDERNWHYPPWQATRVGNLIYGRGASDMKGGLACALHAAQAVQEAGVALNGRLLIESVVGEEDGGLGTLAAVLRGYRADGAILIEPTRLAVAPAQAGALNFSVTVPGLSAHGCVRDEGVSAIEKFVPIHQALLKLEEERNRRIPPLYAHCVLPFALSIGQLQAGNWASSVPEQLVFRGRYGLPPGEDPAAARWQFEEAVAHACYGDHWLRAHPPVVEWWGGQIVPAEIPLDHPLVETVAASFAAATGLPATVEGMTYGADMRLLVHEGQTPAVLFGPGDVRRAHAPDEFVTVSELEATVRSLALAILRFCQAGG